MCDDVSANKSLNGNERETPSTRSPLNPHVWSLLVMGVVACGEGKPIPSVRGWGGLCGPGCGRYVRRAAGTAGRGPVGVRLLPPGCYRRAVTARLGGGRWGCVSHRLRKKVGGGPQTTWERDWELGRKAQEGKARKAQEVKAEWGCRAGTSRGGAG
jgi:hypothetical protein